MLKSDEGIFENGQVKWLSSAPSVSKAHVIVTILEDTTLPVRLRTPPASITGKGKTLGDLVSPIIEEVKNHERIADTRA